MPSHVMRTRLLTTCPVLKKPVPHLQTNELRTTASVIVCGGSALYQQLEDVTADVGWSLRILGGGATPFRIWLALQTLLLDPSQACPLVRQLLSDPGAAYDGDASAASLDAAISNWEGSDAVTAYCAVEGNLNPSQTGAVLAAAAPSITHGITLIQVQMRPPAAAFL